MKDEKIFETISLKANNDIYLGVVGSVRTGKSTFIKRFIETLVIPSTVSDYDKKRCQDEIPQCGAGKGIMTTEPKFVPSGGANIKVDNFESKITLVDCVGYANDEALGFLDENGNPKMVKTPWYDDYIPLLEASEIGTKKVINDHATIGIVVTTDGSITDLKRESYINAEEKVITELKSIGKPFIIVLNTKYPESNLALNIKNELELKYDSPVIISNVDMLSEREVRNILKTALDEFKVENIDINIPSWINVLNDESDIKKEFLLKVKESTSLIVKLKDIDKVNELFRETNYINQGYISHLDKISGTVSINIMANDNLYEETLKSVTKDKLSRASLLKMFIDYNENKEETLYLKESIRMARNTGYGILYPTLNDMTLEEPEIFKDGNRYGVKINAKASSIHMIKVDVDYTFDPVIGSEDQAKEVVNYIMKDNKNDIWKADIFGRKLDTIIKEGISSKLGTIPDNTRIKLSNTVTKIVNKGNGNLIAIVI